MGERKKRPDGSSLHTLGTSSAAIALTLASGILWLPQAGLLAFVIGDSVTAMQPAASLVPMVAAFLLIAVLRSGLDAASHLAAAKTATAAKQRLRARAAERIARFSPMDTTRPKSGELANLISSEIESLDPYLLRYAPARVRMSVLPIVIVVAVFTVSWVAGLLLMVAGPLIPVFMSIIGASAKQRSAAQLTEVGSMTGTLLDRVAGLDTIRLFGASDRMTGDLAATGESIRLRTMSVLRLAFLSSAVLELFSAIGVGLVAVYVGFSLLGWITFGATLAPLTLTSGLFVLLLAPDFFQPLRDFAAAYHDKAAATAAMDRFQNLIERDGARIVGSADAAIEGRAREVGPAIGLTARSVSVVAPQTGRVMLAPVSLDLRPGEHVALMGPSGAGKSTLLAALAGLIETDEGSIAFNGETLSPETAARLRRQTAWIGQSPHVLAASLKANLTLAAPDATPEAIARALDLAACAFADRLPRGLATPVGETGAGLSGGEMRRIAVARAALSSPRLILADEPTASLDAETADWVRRGLLELAAGRTLLVATHDEALARQMDRIVRIEAGVVGLRPVENNDAALVLGQETPA
ncbi:thiol reductant ABC exporter subunit CydD [Hartmannibacter diazotrophicus]|nr:thiol reductant ABC exporter subunit CydD [Hartmannibacter diazotrophicus]